MELKQITDRIFYIPAEEKPLSADVGIIRAEKELWIFDVGASEAAARVVNGLSGPKNVVLSHFHPDHTGNISAVRYDELYAGAYTCRKLGRGTAVGEHRYFEKGVHLFPVPSSHAKGCLGLEYGAYAFLGDGIYSGVKGGQAVYNAGILRELIITLEGLSAEWLLLSHREPFRCSRETALGRLREIYGKRDRRNPYLPWGNQLLTH